MLNLMLITEAKRQLLKQLSAFILHKVIFVTYNFLPGNYNKAEGLTKHKISVSTL